jgi:hypothetical protein
VSANEVFKKRSFRNRLQMYMYMGLRPAYLELFKATTHAQDGMASMNHELGRTMREVVK